MRGSPGSHTGPPRSDHTGLRTHAAVRPETSTDTSPASSVPAAVTLRIEVHVGKVQLSLHNSVRSVLKSPPQTQRGSLTLARLLSVGFSSGMNLSGQKRSVSPTTHSRHFLRPTPQFHRGRNTRARPAGREDTGGGFPVENRAVSRVFRHDATSTAGTTPTAISPLSLRPHFHRKMAFEQQAIFPMLTG